MTPHYDLILVYMNFRRHEHYLNMIQALGNRLRIGLYRIDMSASANLAKLEKTERLFLQECLTRGATLLEEKASCHTLIVPRITDAMAADLPDWIKDKHMHQRLLYLPPGPSHGVLHFKEVYGALGPMTLLAYDLRHFAEIEPETKMFLEKAPMPVLEIGSPYKDYPVFPEFRTDYLIAYPSHLSFPHDWYHYQFLNNIYNVLEGLPKDAEIWVKPHNVRDEGNRLSSRGSFERFPLPQFLTRLLLAVSASVMHLRWKGKHLYQMLPSKYLLRFIWLHNHYIFGRAKNLLDHYPAYGIEHFIGGIQKGLITGLTNSLWEALYQRKPICNCDDLPMAGRPDNFRVMHESFRVGEWKGFSDLGFETISESARSADFIATLAEIPASPVTA